MSETGARAPGTRKARKPGWWYPWIFVGGMLVVIAVNGVMIYIATSTFTGLETEGHYVKGLAYNRDIELARQQRQLGWTSAVSFVPAARDGDVRAGEASVVFRDNLGRPVEDLDVAGMFIRPTAAGFDTRAAFAHVGGGRYAARVELPLPGLWDLRVVAKREGVNYQVVERLNLP